jgi:hypothetical protein
MVRKQLSERTKRTIDVLNLSSKYSCITYHHEEADGHQVFWTTRSYVKGDGKKLNTLTK